MNGYTQKRRTQNLKSTDRINRSNFHVPRTACLKFAVKNYLLVKENIKIDIETKFIPT